MNSIVIGAGFGGIAAALRLKAKGHEIKHLRIKQHYPQKKESEKREDVIWKEHPSRIDKNGIINCPFCKVPSPVGEVKLWGKCGFCRRKELKTD